MIGERVKARLAALRSMPFIEVAALPEVASENVDLGGQRVMLSVYRAARPTGETLIVVQANRQRLFGIYSNVWAEGFLILPSGQTVDAPEQLMWEYT